MVARVAIKEGEEDAASCGIDDLVDVWEREGILRTMPIEISIIHTHPSFTVILFKTNTGLASYFV
jgi:hypothetical protein